MFLILPTMDVMFQASSMILLEDISLANEVIFIFAILYQKTFNIVIKNSILSKNHLTQHTIIKLNLALIMEQQVKLTPEEQYANWKQNCALLYDRLVVTTLDLPSLAFNWLPEKIQSKESTIYKYVFATNSSGSEPEQYLYFAQMEFSKLKKIDEQPTKTIPHNKIYYQITHPGEPNRIIRHPNNPKQVATKTVEGMINLYRQGSQFPIQILTGHTEEGYGLDWKNQGLVSGGYDGQVLVWKNVYDTNSTPTYSGKYEDKIQDTKWLDQNTFLAVSDDGYSSLWDVRAHNSVAKYRWHTAELNTLDVNPFQKQLIITGTGTGVVKLWDLRSPKQEMYPFDGHSDSVIRVEWSPHSSSVFASGSVDSKVNIWDILKVGVEVPVYETTEISNQLTFTHKGHRGAVSDLNWNPYQSMLGSVEQQYNTLQFYQIPSLLNENQSVDLQFQKKQILL